MSFVTKIFAGLSGVIHLLFFLMESVLWSNPAIHARFKVTSIADAATIDVFAKNQGFYNLFLALGIFAALALLRRQYIAGKSLIIYISVFMIAASVVLLLTLPGMLTGVLIQGLPPLLTLLSLRFIQKN